MAALLTMILLLGLANVPASATVSWTSETPDRLPPWNLARQDYSDAMKNPNASDSQINDILFNPADGVDWGFTLTVTTNVPVSADYGPNLVTQLSTLSLGTPKKHTEGLVSNVNIFYDSLLPNATKPSQSALNCDYISSTCGYSLTNQLSADYGVLRGMPEECYDYLNRSSGPYGFNLEASFFALGSELATAGSDAASREANAALDRVWPIVVSRWSSSKLAGRNGWNSELFCLKPRRGEIKESETDSSASRGSPEAFLFWAISLFIAFTSI
ncbi:unnamed protein product [Clonostachys solani]|uniref:Uncharacterized protein n=1 Tax=Clonostachys solani TaxID=160281 RepID=A0A9N9ZP51_9HYPO|nr:unnamed protein product [Clonostachys solani]